MRKHGLFLGARRDAESLELGIFDEEEGAERADGLRRNGEWE